MDGEVAEERRNAIGKWGRSAYEALLGEAVDVRHVETIATRVQRLRADHPDASVDELARTLVAKKCRQVIFLSGLAATCGALPLVGSALAVVLGVGVDLRTRIRLQTELVLELAALYEQPIDAADVMGTRALLAAAAVGGSQLATRGARALRLAAVGRLSQRWLTYGLPVVGMTIAVASSGLSTYLVGRRARAQYGGRRLTATGQ